VVWRAATARGMLLYILPQSISLPLLRPHAAAIGLDGAKACKETPLFLNVSYVCPEPVLVKRSF
jgi:hypothetical protein